MYGEIRNNFSHGSPPLTLYRVVKAETSADQILQPSHPSSTMQKRHLGSLKTPVSAIGLGCMGMSEFYGATDDVESHSTMARALELGVNFLTAPTFMALATMKR